MVIIEGPDGAGKSALVKRLHEDLGIELAPESLLSKKERNSVEYRAPESVRLRTYKALSREVVGRQPPLLYDRLFFSELIYSEAFGREVAFNWNEQIHIGRVMNACKTPVVFCLPPWEAIAKLTLKTDEEEGMNGLSQKLRQVYDTYHNMGTLFMARKREFKVLKGKHGQTYGRTPRDYSLPPVVWFDYTEPTDYKKVKTAVLKYLSHRALRSMNWTGS